MIIHVLGLGETLATYKPDGNITIGVNDIFKHHNVDYLVCVDRPLRFSKERLEIIRKSNPVKFFTINELYNDWRPIVQNLQGFQTAERRGIYNNEILDDQNKICFSNNSTFVAACISYKIIKANYKNIIHPNKPDTIILNGCDFNTHTAFKDNSMKIVLAHFKELLIQLNNRGVNLFVSSSESKLSSVIPVKN